MLNEADTSRAFLSTVATMSFRVKRERGDLGDDLKFVNNIIKQCGYLII